LGLSSIPKIIYDLACFLPPIGDGMTEPINSKAKIGAGGTPGGTGRFFMGLLMMTIGGYLFLSNIVVSNSFSLSQSFWRYGFVNLTQGMVLFPFMFGIGMIFYNSKNVLGWLLSIGSLAILTFGVISSIGFNLRQMNAFELIGILVLMIGGIGLFLGSLRASNT
jgi:hypothetical protein